MKKSVWTAMPTFLVLAILMLVMSIITFRFSRVIAFVELVVSVVAIVVILILTIKFKTYVNEMVKTVDNSIHDISDRYIDQIKTPAVVVGQNDEMIIFNTKFKKTFFPLRSPINESIYELLSEDDIRRTQKATYAEVEIEDKIYNVFSRKVSKGTLFDFVDITKYKKIEKELEDSKKSVGIIAFDNAEDFNDDDENVAVQVAIQVEGVLLAWANENNVLYRKLADSRYLVIFDEKVLKNEIYKKFPLLDEVRKIENNGRRATISVGIAQNFSSLRESQINARKALDMALGRGGDQVALLDNNEYSFFGGLSRGVERTNNVRVRIIAESIKKELENCERVLIMGHKTSDLDCIGSAAGVYSFVMKKFQKPCYIVVNEDRTLATPMIKYLSDSDKEKFISAERAMIYANNKTLLFVVDTHSPDFVESEKVLEACGRTIIIDHHRKMVNYIDDAQVNFHNPGASSTSELVTDLVRYLGDDTISRQEAEALLAGIMLDTKNFILKTGIGTFEAAAYLKKKGADTVAVRDVFSNSIDNYTNKSELVSKAEKINSCAITIEDQNIPNSRVVCAQAADDLLSIQGIYASFVISKFDDNTVNISARSFGKINVQVIMEKLGGGGHQTMAATQIKNISFKEARDRLVEVLKDVEVM